MTSGNDGAAPRSVRPARPEDAGAIGDIQAQTLAVTLAVGLEVTPAVLPSEVRAMLVPEQFAAAWEAAISEPPTPRHHTLVAVDDEEVVGFAAIVPADQILDVTPAGPIDERDAAEAAEVVPQAPRPQAPSGTGAADSAREAFEQRVADGATLGAPQPSQEELAAASAERDAREVRPRVVAEIVALEVPAKFGRRGHGSRLVAACVDLARQEGATHVQTWAVQGEESRVRFLDACGFAPVGLRRVSDVGGKRLVELAWYAEL